MHGYAGIYPQFSLMPEPTPWYILINPQAGGGKSRRVWRELQRALEAEGFPYAYASTTAPWQAVSLIHAALDAGYRRFVALGGDGTVFEVVNGLCTHPTVPVGETVLTQLPVGTGCDWARYHRLPRQPQQVLAILKQPQLRWQDLGKVDFVAEGQACTRYFANAAGLGFDAFVLQQAASQPKGGWQGKLYYLLGLLRSLRAYQPAWMQVSRPEELLRQAGCLTLMLGLGPYAGGGMRLCPGALPHDGQLAVTFIDALSPWEVICNLPRLYNGKLYGHPRVYHWRGSRFSVQADPATWLELDGECVGHAPARFEILPRALRVAGG